MVVLLIGITLYSGKYVVRRPFIASLVYFCTGACSTVALTWPFGHNDQVAGLRQQRCSRRLIDLSCAHYLVQPNKSFKPTLLRGSNCVHTLR